MNLASDSNNEYDVPINVNSQRDLSDVDKIPDVVKSLRTFTGDPNEFLPWRKSGFEKSMNISEVLPNISVYYQ